MNTARQSRNESSAELHERVASRFRIGTVSQICNLRALGKVPAQLASERLPIKNRRYSRFEICATGVQILIRVYPCSSVL
jgi:hypothetical protein